MSDGSWLKNLEALHPNPKPAHSYANGAPPSGPNLNPTIDDPRTRGAVQGAIKSSWANIQTAPRGTRNDMLNVEAYNLGQLVGHNLLTEEQVREHLMDACRASGLAHDDGEEQCRKTIDSGLSKGRLVRRDNLPVMDPPKVSDGEVKGWEDVVVDGDDPLADTKEPADWRVVSGGPFILDVPDKIPTLWADGERILWAEGETMMIAGGQGLGKTTLAGQILRAQILGGEVLDMPVTQLEPGQKILYLAMDRPRQIARSLGRQFTAKDRKALDEHLIVRPGPPIVDMAAYPEMMTAMGTELGASVIYVDSLKDAAIGLVEDAVAAGWNRARQMCLNAGIQLCELHHNKKTKNNDNWDLSDVYGSNWITAGVGSVIMLTGQPGDPIIGFRHIKQPSEEVGPFRLLHEQHEGVMSIHHDVDLLEMAMYAGADGLTAKGAAAAMFDTENPGRGEVEKARRKLMKLTEDGWLREVAGQRGGGPASWHPTNKSRVAPEDWSDD